MTQKRAPQIRYTIRRNTATIIYNERFDGLLFDFVYMQFHILPFMSDDTIILIS